MKNITKKKPIIRRIHESSFLIIKKNIWNIYTQNLNEYFLMKTRRDFQNIGKKA